MFPGAIFERRYNAKQVEREGGGFMGELSNFNRAWIRAKIDQLESLRSSLSRIQGEFHALKGARSAYTRICEWMSLR